MSGIEERLLQASKQTFSKFCSGLSKIDVVTAGAFGLAAGAVTYAVGFGMDISHQGAIMSAGGKEALEAYRALSPDSALAFLGRALAGELPSTGQNLQGAGVWMMMTLPGVSALAAKLLKNYGETHAPEQDRPRGATRVSFADAMNRTLDGVGTQAKQEPKPMRGPR